MDLSRYLLVRAEPDAEWDEFVQASPQGTIFSTRAFLGALDGRPGLWYCLKNDDCRAAVAVIESANGDAAVDHDLMVYNGIMLAPGDPSQSRAQLVSEYFRTTSFIVAELARCYRGIVIRTHPALEDARPFLWHNYGNSGPKFDVDLRYTSFVALDGFRTQGGVETNPLYLAANKSRRQEIRYGLRGGVRTEGRYDPDLFYSLYEATFDRQGLAPGQNRKELGRVLDALHADGRLRMFVCADRHGEPGSIAVFGLDDKRGNYLFGANDPAIRDGHTGTMVLWDAFSALAPTIDEVDLEGVNSPRRGYFKLSFGGTITPYYQLTLRPQP